MLTGVRFAHRARTGAADDRAEAARSGSLDGEIAAVEETEGLKAREVREPLLCGAD